MGTGEGICPECGGALGADAPMGVCPKCVLRVMIDAGSPTGPHVPPPPGEGGMPGAESLAALFPNLEILGEIGRGGMGVVFKARQTKLDRLVALKVIRPDAAERDAFAERFTREARAMARLNHPHILTVHDFGEAGGLYYIVMELVEGTDLRRELARGPMRPERAVGLALQVCDVLGYAHEQGVVHRDIKPENVLIDRIRGVKLADFGLAKIVVPDSPDPTLTATRHVLGTPHYMAPEQLERPREVDRRADVYALGVVLYEMLMGELPLGRYDLPSERLDLDEQMDEILNKALQRDPARRYPRVEEMRAELFAFAEDNYEPDDIRAAVAAPALPLGSPAEGCGPAGGAGEWGWFWPLAWCAFAVGIPLLFFYKFARNVLLGAIDEVSRVRLRVVASWERDPVATGIWAAALALVGLWLAVAASRKALAVKRVGPGDSEGPDRALDSARDAVKWPAIGLIACGLVNLLGLVVVFVGVVVPILGSPQVADGTPTTATPRVVILVPFLACVAGSILGGPILLGGVRMLQLHGRTAALLAAVLAMLPVAPGAVLGLPAGLWALLVLTRREIAAAFRLADRGALSATGPDSGHAVGASGDRAEWPGEATDAPRTPMVGLICVGAANLLVGLVALLGFSAFAWGEYRRLEASGARMPLAEVMSSPWTFLGLKLSFSTALIGGAVLVFGLAALGGRRTRSAIAASVLAMLIPSPLILVNLPVGLWALSTLARSSDSGRARPRPIFEKPDPIRESAIAGSTPTSDRLE